MVMVEVSRLVMCEAMCRGTNVVSWLGNLYPVVRIMLPCLNRRRLCSKKGAGKKRIAADIDFSF